jgi:hypothetical protein
MKATIRDREALRAVSPSDIGAYLTAKNWQAAQSGSLQWWRPSDTNWAIPLTHVRCRRPLLVVVLRRRRGGRRRMFLTIDRYGAGSTATGVRVSWKIVPAVTEVCRPQDAHCTVPHAPMLMELMDIPYPRRVTRVLATALDATVTAFVPTTSSRRHVSATLYQSE